MDKIFVSSDSKEILECVASHLPTVGLIKRPEEFATDTASTESLVEHFTSLMEYSKLTLIQITSPMTTVEDFKQAHRAFDQNQYDSLFAGGSCRSAFIGRLILSHSTMIR